MQAGSLGSDICLAKELNLPECLALGHSEQRQLVAVRIVEWDGVAPPGLDGVQTNGTLPRILQREEDEDGGKRDSRVERGGQHVCGFNNRGSDTRAPAQATERRERTVVLCPPREVAPADDEVEDEADDAPADVVERRRRRQQARAAEDDGPVDVLEHRVAEALLDEPLRTKSAVRRA